LKERLNEASEWLEKEPGEKANIVAKPFNVKASAIRMRQL